VSGIGMAKHVRLVVLEGSGHLFLPDEPELAARHVEEFLRR
jgi:pimeloyl-ACP methyl ester carboxylesterase